MNQNELLAEVSAIKRRVRYTIGIDLNHEFRSSQVYQAYTGLCGEAQMAYEDDQLDDQLITLLEEYADKVIALCQEESAK